MVGSFARWLRLEYVEGACCGGNSRLSPRTSAGTLECVSQPFGKREEMTSRQGSRNAIVPHSGQTHRRDATTLLAIGGSAELAWRDGGDKIGGNRFRSPGEDAVCGRFRR